MRRDQNETKSELIVLLKYFSMEWFLYKRKIRLARFDMG